MAHDFTSLGEAILRNLWNIVRWIAFFFKLVSLAFVVPIIGLIIFDFCLWLWRLYRPSRPADSPHPSPRLPKDYVQQQPPPTPIKARSSAISHETEPKTPEKRVAHGPLTND
ncbi:hypothetical protein F5B22DRAFT_522385 [Xylaria bambusicola]|uniref:uncharacterized protein n=1 Tax=Xylaria bambusicola TaxID=326684 RepID=UPI002007238B|nr:uncharacterized protein F5B22DRAFT_522385 [Xylaria bambusicola]KAI0505508.1 hypothetical protein F5B22DRAFT_522385 [Xylaria bambusicola]